jgi:hypothetical protein
MKSSKTNTPTGSTPSQVKRIAIDLHNALTEVPVDTAYFEKLEMYGQKLIEEYNWHRVEVYSTHQELDALVTGARVTTSTNSLAVKHKTGWVILTQEGYSFSYRASTDLALPVFSIPEARRQSPDVSSLDDGSHGSQIPETDNKR